MGEEEAKELCYALMESDSEKEVTNLLKEAGYWDDANVWRDYGDVENNYSQAGNQANTAEAALVEKLTNSRDARLMNVCRERGIDPEGPHAPKSLKKAVAEFFESNPDSDIAGQIEEWSNRKRREVAQGITLAATGAQPRDGYPCFTISDCGEGQTPDKLPHTILSLKESIKMRIPFVHGRFNMGGTAVLRFCGERNFQLVLSRRNPALIEDFHSKPSDHKWGFTVVRREYPEGNRVSSIYRYLAPVGAAEEPRMGGVLRFSADSMPIFPEGQEAYSRHSEWGTLIKLYEYKTRYRSKLFLDRGLLRPLDLRLPDIGLPIRLYECRSGYSGHGGSHETTLNGLKVRLHDDRGNNLEDGYPTSHSMKVDGNPMSVSVYAFKEGKAGTYRNAKDAILFTLNGQTQGALHERFFRRKNVKMGYLKDSLIVFADCSNFSNAAKEELFMNSRDRLSTGELREKVENKLEELIGNHPGLKKLREQRRREKKKEKLDDSKPLEQVLESLLSHSPTLSRLFIKGERLSNPFKSEKVESEEEDYQGREFPSYFKFKKVDYGETLERNCHIDQRSRVFFETDAENDYFDRNRNPGEFEIYQVKDGEHVPVESYVLNLFNGIATLNLDLPSDSSVGDDLHFVSRVTDPMRIADPPFENHFILHVKGPTKNSTSNGRKRRKPPSKEQGNDRELPSGLQLPDVTEVYESPDKGTSWEDMAPPFDQFSALSIIDAGLTDDEGNPSSVYDFFINMDNVYLNTEIKSNNKDEEIVSSQFKYGMVLVGLAILHNEESRKDRHDSNGVTEDNYQNELTVEEKVEEFTQAIAPVMIPIIDELGDLDLEDELVG